MAITNSDINSGVNDIAITDVSGNVIGLDVQKLIVPNASNISIPGGSNGQVIATDGLGNLYWTIPGSGEIIAPELAAGNSNIEIIEDGDITFSSGGVANVMVVSNVGTAINANTVLPDIANVKIAGGANNSVLFSGVNNTLQWGGSQILMPVQGTGFGWVIANGLRIYRSGIGNADGRVGSWRSGTNSTRPLSVSVLHDDMPPITRWLKIHSNVSCMYALGDNGVLYSHGWDSQGQQGNSTANVPNEVLTPITHSTLYGTGIRVINFWSNDGAGNSSVDLGSVFVNVDDNGTMKTYAFGANYDGVLGIGSTTVAQHIPVIIPQLAGKTIANVSLRETDVLIVTTDGEVWGAGYNIHGQLGLGNTTNPIRTLSRATKADGTLFTNAVNVYVMWSEGIEINSYVLCSDGSLWSCGGNLDGVCGIGTDTRNISRFNRVLISNPVTQFTCSRATAAAIDDEFNMYGFGRNYEGEWGLGGIDQQSNIPTLIQNNVKRVQAMGRLRGNKLHAFLWIDTENRTWGSGANNYTQLGIGVAAGNVQQPLPVFFGTDDEYCVEILPIGFATTNDTPSDYYVGCMFRTNLNKIYVSGRNSHSASINRDNSIYFTSPVEITGIL